MQLRKTRCHKFIDRIVDSHYNKWRDLQLYRGKLSMKHV